MLSEAIDAVAAALKAVFIAFVWNIVLFNLGRYALLLMTAGRYPHGRLLDAHVNRICAAGFAVLVMAWSMLALYNNLHTEHV
ncbi:hypothetical protein [Dokdonella soli]|uniref:MAPEG family protein n=1 Tax=Dokdonella soli TaxID=529810 RepID=A0ABP3TZE7_9GAMM